MKLVLSALPAKANIRQTLWFSLVCWGKYHFQNHMSLSY